jgi:hypothetical protein
MAAPGKCLRQFCLAVSHCRHLTRKLPENATAQTKRPRIAPGPFCLANASWAAVRIATNDLDVDRRPLIKVGGSVTAAVTEKLAPRQLFIFL